MELYSVYDKTSKKEADLLFFENDETAIRSTSNMIINEAKKNILLNINDFELHKIEGVHISTDEESGCKSVYVDGCSGVKCDEGDLLFHSRFIYDFASIDIEKIRSVYETERLAKIEKELDSIVSRLSRG